MTFPIEKHLDGHNIAQLLNFKFNPQPSDPTSPVASVIWYNTTENVLKYFDGTAIKIVATLADITTIGRYRGSWDTSNGVPTAADSTNYPGDAIRGGDFWRVSVGGTIAGLLGEADLEGGDLIFADVPNANTANQFFGANTNVSLAEGADQKEQTFTGVSLVAGTPTDVVGTTISTIASYQILDGTKDVTFAFEVDVDDTTPKISINSLSNYSGLKVKLTGIAA